MPGYLQSQKKFMQRYGGRTTTDPGQQGDGPGTLAAKVRPFILRRLKEEVLSELPPKIEHRLLSELTREQKKLYLAYLERLRNETRECIRDEGFNKSRIQILAGLTRLRQICCHPALFVENYRGESAKLLQLQELLREAVDGGHRILLFSQFTKMLQLIRAMLDRDGYRYFYLDGSVKTEDRLQMIESFNNGNAEIFLISLKAGGTGLNLTGADIVIQYDLWWNPAVEEQAAGRAHRIGQKKVVQVIRLLAKDTIEEKIYELQQKKKELIDRVIQPGETFLSAMSEDDLREILEI
jgi:SNF2 family DNA or RNA helicase